MKIKVLTTQIIALKLQIKRRILKSITIKISATIHPSLGTHFLFFVLGFFKVFIISCRTLQFKNINNLGRENVRKKGDNYEKNTILSLF